MFSFQKPIIFGVCLLIMGCNSNDDSQPPAEEFPISNYAYVVSGKINGQDFVMGQLQSGTSLDYGLVDSGSGTSICAYAPETGGINYYSGVYPYVDADTRPGIGIEFIRFFLCSEFENFSQSEVFNDRFPIGSYDYSSDGLQSVGPTSTIGFEYATIATEGPFYNSYGDQTGSYFEITSTTPQNSYLLDVLVESRQVIEGNFSVKLYNELDSSDVITITDGHFKLLPHL